MSEETNPVLEIEKRKNKGLLRLLQTSLAGIFLGAAIGISSSVYSSSINNSHLRNPEITRYCEIRKSKETLEYELENLKENLPQIEYDNPRVNNLLSEGYNSPRRDSLEKSLQIVNEDLETQGTKQEVIDWKTAQDDANKVAFSGFGIGASIMLASMALPFVGNYFLKRRRDEELKEFRRKEDE